MQNQERITMAAPDQIIETARRVFADLSVTKKSIAADLERLAAPKVSPLEIMELSTVHPPHAETTAEIMMPSSSELAKVISEGLNALDQIENGVELPPQRQVGLEAIVHLYGRPALLIQDNDFPQPPPEWTKLNTARDMINAILPSVGRVDLENHHTYEWVGTGFLVGPELVMTNRHVATVFSERDGGSWSFVPDVRAKIDYKEEFRRDQRNEFAIREVLGTHPRYDLALLRAEATGEDGQDPPKPLTIAAQEARGREGPGRFRRPLPRVGREEERSKGDAPNLPAHVQRQAPPDRPQYRPVELLRRARLFNARRQFRLVRL